MTDQESRYDSGVKLLLELHDDRAKALLETMSDVAPDLARFVAEWAFCDIYQRPGLDLQRRQLITVACLTTLGTEEQLRSHLKTSLDVGLTPAEIVEALMQCLPYVGFPRVLNAVTAARTIFAERKLLPVES